MLYDVTKILKVISEKTSTRDQEQIPGLLDMVQVLCHGQRQVLIPTSGAPWNAVRQGVEVVVIRAIHHVMKGAGYVPRVASWMDEYPSEPTPEQDAQFWADNARAVDEFQWYWKAPEGKHACVVLVFGNSGWDTLCDMSTSLSDIIDPVMSEIEDHLIPVEVNL